MRRAINQTAPIKKTSETSCTKKNKSPTPHARSWGGFNLRNTVDTARPTSSKAHRSLTPRACGNLKYSIIESRGFPSFSLRYSNILQQENSCQSRRNVECEARSTLTLCLDPTLPSLYKYQTRGTNQRRRRCHQICTGKPISYVPYRFFHVCVQRCTSCESSGFENCTNVANSNFLEGLWKTNGLRPTDRKY